MEVWASEKPSFLYHEYHEFVAGHLRFVARSSWSFGLAIQRPKAWVDNVSCKEKTRPTVSSTAICFLQFFFNL